MKLSLIVKTCSFYLFAIILTSLILAYMVHVPGFDLSLPRMYAYSGDSLFSSMMVKTIMDTGWVLNNPYLGAPLHYSLADYPQSDIATFFIIKMLAGISNNYAVILNCFYFLTFPLITLFSLFTFHYLGMNKVFSLVASLLFAFLPYHLIRNESHLLLGAYYVIPIYVLLIFSVFSPGFFATKTKTFSLTKCLLYVVACLFAASSGVYYAFFACYLLLVAGLLASITHKEWRPLLKAGMLIALISMTILINIFPTFISQIKNGKNIEIANRTPNESENAGLKIAQLLLPVNQHHLKPLRQLKEHYNQSAPLVNENNTASLGLIGSCGFLLLIILLLLRKSFVVDNRLIIFSQLNLCAILLATIGGFSTIFAYIVSPMIRSYNRISVFIAFFALYAFFMVLQDLLKKYDIQCYIRNCLIIAFLLLPIGLLDQIGKKSGINPNYAQMKETFSKDNQFIAEIEKLMPPQSMIFQLPVFGFPESPAIYQMKDYELFRAYLHSHHLRWSYGAIRGRNTLAWQQEVSKKPLKQMLNELIYAGFTGLFIDRDGFQDNGRQIEKQLTHLLNEKPLMSLHQNKTFLFYDLRNYRDKLQHSMTTTAWQTQLKKTESQFGLTVNWGKGFYNLETAADNPSTTWRWSKQKGRLRIINVTDHPIQASMRFQLQTGYLEKAKINIHSDLFDERISVSQSESNIKKQLTITPGLHNIFFKTTAQQIDSGADRRHLFFRINNFRLDTLS